MLPVTGYAILKKLCTLFYLTITVKFSLRALANKYPLSIMDQTDTNYEAECQLLIHYSLLFLKQKKAKTKTKQTLLTIHSNFGGVVKQFNTNKRTDAYFKLTSICSTYIKTKPLIDTRAFVFACGARKKNGA